jgi:hypothetical protein
VFMQFQVEKSSETVSEAPSAAKRQHNDIHDVTPGTGRTIKSGSPFVRI